MVISGIDGRKRVFASLLALLFLVTLTPSLAGPHFERIGSASRPVPSVITALYQDQAGFIWIGSRDGLTMYDGHSFLAFEHDASDPTSISDNAIRTIYEDSRQDLWIGTNTGGLNRLDRATWTFEHFRHHSANPTSISHDSVYAVVEDRSGALWVGTQKGLNRFDPASGTFERIVAEPGVAGSLRIDYIIALFVDGSDQLWVGTEGGGLYRHDADSDEFTAFRHDAADPRTLSSDQVFALAEDSFGSLWVGTHDGLNRLNSDGTFERFLHSEDDPSGLSEGLVTTLATGPDGVLWIGTLGGGVNELDSATGEIRAWRSAEGTPGGFADDSVMSLLVDSRGALWIGTWGGGLSRVGATARSLATPGTTPSGWDEAYANNVTSLMLDHRGDVWLGTSGGLVIRTGATEESARTYKLKELIGASAFVLGMHEDRDGKIWMGLNWGLARFDPLSGTTGVFRHDPGDPASLGRGYVKPILEDRQGRIWIGTGEGGVQQIGSDGHVISRFLHDPNNPSSISDNYVTFLLEDAQGTMWVGTRSGGLNALDPETRRAVRYGPVPGDATSISHHYVTSILEDSKGRLWIATAGGGLNLAERTDDGRLGFTRFGESDGLIDDDVMALLEDVDGTLWLSTKRGLGRFDPESGDFVSLYVSDGLPSAEFEPAAAVRSQDALCFGSVRGPVAVPIGTPFPERKASPILVAAVETSNGVIPLDRPAWLLDHLELPYGERLSIELAVLDYSVEQRHRYAYRLDDQEEWVDLGDSREISFTSLAPGNYRFSARGQNSQGVLSETSPILAITVVPPFWMTLWFRLLAVAAVVLLVGGGHLVRMSRLEKSNRELLRLHEQREKAREDLRVAYDRLRRLTRRLEAAKEDERKRIARELHDELGQTLTAVRINVQLIRQNTDPAGAEKRFKETTELVDRMIERIGDMSLDLRPPLLDDLGLVLGLRGYLGALAKRSGIKLDVRGDDVPTELPAEVEIVGFRVVQEAVTNAIRHSGAKRVTIDVRRKTGGLELEVIDDGSGFDIESTMKRAYAGQHLGLLGIEERVHMLDGDLVVRSDPGEGTYIRVFLPMEAGS